MSLTIKNNSIVPRPSEPPIDPVNKEKESINGRDRIEPGTSGSIEPRVRTEWVECSGIPEHLYRANCFIGKEPGLIQEQTSWPVKKLRVIGAPRSTKEAGLDISAGYWYAHRIDWQTGSTDWKTAQYKPLGGAVSKDGKKVKYVSSTASRSQVYTLAVTLAEIESAERVTGASFTLRQGLTEENASQRYWQWAIENPAVPLVVTEGIKKALALIGQGYPAIALPGVNNIWSKNDSEASKALVADLQLLRQASKPVHLCFDADIVEKPQVKKALKVLGSELLKPVHGASNGASVHVWSWPVIEGKGIDDVLVTQGHSRVAQIAAQSMPYAEWAAGASDRSWPQMVLEDLIEDRLGLYFVEIAGALHKYNPQTGVYEFCEDAKKWVSDALKQTDDPFASAEKGSFVNASNPQRTKDLLEHISHQRVVVNAAVNPKRAWCTPNGVLQVEIKQTGDRWSVETDIRPHSPYKDRGDIVFTERTEWNYDPNANGVHLHHFLGFCPELCKNTLLDYLSCSLDGAIARAVLGRNVRGLFLVGEGSNGKDTLRKLLHILYPMRVSAIGLAQIKHHDRDPQKFGLSGMDEKTAVNFSSENPSQDISKNETFKSLVTADPVIMADKGVTQRQVAVQALQVHCTNREMFVSNPQVSVTSRIAVLPLPYSFLPQKEIDKKPRGARANLRLVDTRYGDRAWVCANVVPALFNEFLARFERVLNDRSIDWSCCDEANADIVLRSDHVRAFLFASGLVEQTSSDDDFERTADLYQLYCDYCCEVIDRAELRLDSSEYRLTEVDAKGHAAKHDPLCTNVKAFSTRIGVLLGAQTARKSMGGKQERVFTGIKIKDS